MSSKQLQDVEIQDKSSSAENQSSTVITLQLGDVIRLKDETNDVLNNQSFLIDYIDTRFMKLINVDNLTMIQLNIEGGIITPGNISGIDLVYRNDTDGYARQNGLIPGKWINVYFGGDVPVVITGEITNIEEDMIEVKTFPEGDVLYINFAYKGIPEDLPINTIEIREAPERETVRGDEDVEVEDGEEMTDKEKVLSEDGLDEVGINEDYTNRPDLEDGEIYEEQAVLQAPPKKLQNAVNTIIIRANEIYFGEDMGSITQVVDVDPKQQRYNIEAQANDLLDELLSQVPNSERTDSVKDNIHTMISRFKQLRTKFSNFDEYGTIIGGRNKGHNWKPLVDNLKSFKQKLYWLVPVVKNVKKVYNINANEDSKFNDIIESSTIDSIVDIKNAEEQYHSGSTPSEENKYVSLYSELNGQFTPFIDINPEDVSQIIHSIDVETNLDTIIDTLGDFYSTIVENDIAKKRRFVMQTYNTALTRLETTTLTNSKMVSHTINIAPSDRMEISSIVTLPEPTIRFSNINMPGTNILQKANLNLHFLEYWRLLKTKTPIENVIIDDLAKEPELDEARFVNNVKNYVLSVVEPLNPDDHMDVKTKYNKFTDMIVPKTRILFNLMKKYINGRLSLVSVIDYLEPFMIYTDDLTFMQAEDINEFIRGEIGKYNKAFIANGNVFKMLKTIGSLSKGGNKLNFKQIRDTLRRNPKLQADVFIDTYNLLENTVTNTEALNKMTVNDYGDVFNNAVALKNIGLMVPESISDLLLSQQVDLDKAIEKETKDDKCIRYVIAKEYHTLAELNDDNGKQIFFDRKYDTTKYAVFEDKNGIVEKDVSNAERNMAADKYSDYLIKRLQKKSGYSLDDAKELVESIMDGYKKVKDGHIAFIYDLTGDKLTYYVRKNNRWELDDTIPADVVTSSQNLLCNFQKDCIEIEKKYDSVCESTGLNKSELTKSALNDILKNFDNDYEKSRADLEKYVNEQFDYHMSVYDKIQIIRHIQRFRYNKMQFDIGYLTEETESGELAMKVSPFLGLLNKIMGQQDFVKKHSDIVKFALRYAREANEDPKYGENIHFLYCKETNTQLLPTFILALAQCYVETPDLYMKKMDEIINTNGKESDDGDAWVDKYSGDVICRKDFDTDEGYDDGYKIHSREIMEKDAGDAMLDPSGKSKEVIKYETIESIMANKVINSLSNFMGVNIDSQREFMLKIINDTLPIAMPKEKDYIEKIKSRAKSGKAIPEYSVIFNSTIMYLTLGALLIGVQVSMPSIKTRKTFPGCVRSFVGYPFDGLGDMTALDYISCITHKVKSDVDPWSGLTRTKEEVISAKTKAFIDTYYLKNADVNRKFQEKTEYMLLNPTQEIPAEHDISKWMEFLPPLVSFKITQLANISSDFKSRMLGHIKAGSGQQRDDLLIIESKAMRFSLAIQEKIQNIIDKKKLLMSNSANEPFLENACCNERDGNNVAIKYFNDEDSDILRFNDIVADLSNMRRDISLLTQAPYLFSNENTKNIYPTISNDYNEETIYAAFIHFCRFNTDTPIPEDLLPLCTVKPDYINRKDSLQDKIRKLKQDGKVYTSDDLIRLLQIISRRNIMQVTTEYGNSSQISRLKDIIETIHAKDDDHVPAALVQNIEGIVDTFDIAMKSETSEVRTLKNYLMRTNETLKAELFEFINVNGSISKMHKRKVKTMLETFTTWNILDDDRSNTLSITDNAMYTVIQFIKSYSYSLIKVFPNIILNEVDYSNVKIPRYYGFAKGHDLDLKSKIEKYYKQLVKFYSNKTIEPILREIQKANENLLLLIMETPGLTDITYKGSTTKSIFERETSMLLFENYLLQCFKGYIDLSSNPDIIASQLSVSLDDIARDTMDTAQDRERRLGFIGFEKRLQDGDLKSLKKTVADLLIAYLNIFDSHKTIIDLPYEKIADVVFKSKESEKDTFTDRLQALSDEAREIDTILKINKLSHWGKGANVADYSKNTFADDQLNRERMQIIETNVRKKSGAVDANVDQYVDDYLEEEAVDKEIEHEENDMSRIGEDYMDGDPGGDEDDGGDMY